MKLNKDNKIAQDDGWGQILAWKALSNLIFHSELLIPDILPLYPFPLYICSRNGVYGKNFPKFGLVPIIE